MAKDLLHEVGFHFTDSGEFLDDEESKKFQFNSDPSHAKNQIRYEQIGEAITEYIYKVMKDTYNLERVYIPVELENSEDSQSFVFCSSKFMESGNKKLILINGSGAVKAGQWARSIIINNNLFAGSMFPYISWGQENGFDILVLNTNESDKEKPGSRDPVEHAITVWNDFIQPIDNVQVYIVAHSYGGIVTQVLSKNAKKFHKKVTKIAFTDSVHFSTLNHNDSKQIPIINWVSSSKPLDTDLGFQNGCHILSAGTNKHPWTSHYAKESIFKWFTESCDDNDSNKTSSKFSKFFNLLQSSSKSKENNSKDDAANTDISEDPIVIDDTHQSNIIQNKLEDFVIDSQTTDDISIDNAVSQSEKEQTEEEQEPGGVTNLDGKSDNTDIDTVFDENDAKRMRTDL